MKPPVLTWTFVLICIYSVQYAQAVTNTLSLQRPQDIVNLTSVTFNCVSEGTGPDPTLRWFVKDPTNSATILYDLTSQANTDASDGDGEITSRLTITVNPTYENNRLWCSAFDSGQSSASVEVYADIRVTKVSLGQSCAVLPCVTGNTCASSQICVCSTGYYDSNGNQAGGTCLQQVNLGASCTFGYSSCSPANSECSSSTLTCVCQSGYTQSGSSCVTAGLGSSCTTNSNCQTANSVCSSNQCTCATNFYQSGASCLAQSGLDGSCSSSSGCYTTNSFCSNGLCKCQSGYFDDNGGITGGNCDLQKQLGQTCSPYIQFYCGTAYSYCNSGVCTCQSGFYDNNGNYAGGFCYQQSQLGQSCNPSVAYNCGTNNAICSSSTNLCVCNTNYYDSTPNALGGSCLPVSSVGLGTSCSSTSVCSTSQSSCINNVCQCNTNYYDSNGNSNGGSCLIQSSYGQSCSPSIPNNCGGSNTVCSSSSNTCVCDTNYYFTSGTCQPSVGLGSSCTSTAQCSTTQSSCISFVCQCNTGYYDTDGNTIGGSCLTQASYGQSCSPSIPNNCGGSNTVCSSTSNTCACATNYYFTSGTCQPSVGLGSSCTSTAQCSTTQSSCINLVCQCNSGYYDSNGGTFAGSCVTQASYGQSCSPSIPNNCGGSNTVCSSTSNTCACATNYYFTSGTCQASVSLGGTCTATAQCSSATSQSSCVSSVCRCNTGYYNNNAGSCLAQISLGNSCTSTSACADANAICTGTPLTCQCRSSYTNQGGVCTSTSSSSCPTSTQSAVTSTGSTSPVAPDVTVQATCYLVNLYDTQIMPCADTKRSTALRTGGWFKRNTAGTWTAVVISTDGFINGDITNPNLTMSNAQASFAGNYMCRLCYGLSFTQCTDSSAIEVRISGSDITSVAMSVSSATPTRGSSITFTCSETPAGTATSYSWTRDSVTVAGSSSTLTISSVQTSNDGVYSCTAINQYSSASSSSPVTLNVQYAPEYSLSGGGDTETIFATLDTASATIVCSVTGNPTVTYTFYDATGTSLYTGSSNQLTVTSSMGYQRYYCTGANALGSSSNLYLDVQESSSLNTGAATEDDGGISTGIIAAIVIGLIFLLLLIIIIIICCCNYGWCRKKEKVEPQVITQPPVKPYIPRTILSDQSSEVSRKDVGIMMNGHQIISTEFEEPPLEPRYYLKPATNSGPIISMFEDNYGTPRAHQLPALDTQYLYRDEEPKKKRRRRRKKRHHHEPEPEPRYAEVQPPEDDDLVVIPGRNNYYE